jgi:hypothetical protein
MRAIAAGVPFGCVAADTVYGTGEVEMALRPRAGAGSSVDHLEEGSLNVRPAVRSDAAQSSGQRSMDEEYTSRRRFSISVGCRSWVSFNFGPCRSQALVHKRQANTTLKGPRQWARWAGHLSSVVSNLALKRGVASFSSGPFGGMGPVGSFDEFAVLTDGPLKMPGGLFTGEGFQGVGIPPIVFAYARHMA